jgi:hypothetical protein
VWQCTPPHEVVASSVHVRGLGVGSSGVSIATAVSNERRIVVPCDFHPFPS